MTAATLARKDTEKPTPQDNAKLHRSFIRRLAKMQTDFGNLAEGLRFGDTSDALTARWHIRSAGRASEPVALHEGSVWGGRVLDPKWARAQLVQVAGSLIELGAMLGELTGDKSFDVIQAAKHLSG